MSRRSLAFGLCFLLICSVFIPLSLGFNVKVSRIEQSSILGNGKTLYVGGSGAGNYSKIQDAIDNASDGDIVYVYDDSSPYYENIIVDKSISLIGEDKVTTVIDGMGDRDKSSVTITASKVNLNGFTIKNSTRGNTYGVWIKEGNENIITDNIFTKDYYGIYIYPYGKESKKNIISYNIINNCSFSGIDVVHSSDNLITHNTVYNCVFDIRYGGGISVDSGDNTIITYNDVRYNGVGIWVGESDNVLISLNNVIQNFHGISTFSSNNIKIVNNNIFKNKGRNVVNTIINNQNLNINGNYWGRPRIFPIIIPDIRLIYLFTLKIPIVIDWYYYYFYLPIYLPLLKIALDKNPAQKPYDI